MTINRSLSKTFRVTHSSIIRPSNHNRIVLQLSAFRYCTTKSISKNHLTPANNKFGGNIYIFNGSIPRVLASPSQTRLLSSFTMSSKLIPSNPSDVAVIRTVTPNVVTVSVPFARFGIVRVGGRGTIIRLTSGTLAVFSPVALTPETKSKITELGGNVGYIIAGDIEHHIFISEWSTAYPSARIVGPKGLAEKRAKVHDDPKIGHEPFAFEWTAANHTSNAVSDEFAADFEVEYVDAHPNKEVVLFYKPDRVLIQADLMFNLPATEQYSRVPSAQKASHGFLNRIFESINSTSGEAKGIKRFLWYAVSGKDRAGFNESVRRIAGWDFDKIIPCHGETVVEGGKELFNKVFEWHLQGHK
ncbi:hypothetical protein F5Y02DRAFT_237816 [Annulohypoxylon stygium]|nr:hypothetical protein F5Y02DRAFT_237816 [Annulohypoxylon stygium]